DCGSKRGVARAGSLIPSFGISSEQPTRYPLSADRARKYTADSASLFPACACCFHLDSPQCGGVPFRNFIRRLERSGRFASDRRAGALRGCLAGFILAYFHSALSAPL